MKRFFIVLVLLLGTVNLFGGPEAAYLKCSCGEEIYSDLNEVYEHREHLTDLEITDFIYDGLNDEYTFYDEYDVYGRTVDNLIDKIADTDDKKNFFCKYMKVFIEKEEYLTYRKKREEENRTYCKKIVNEKAKAETNLEKKIVVGDWLKDFIFTDSNQVTGTITEICLVKDDLWRIECTDSEKIFKFYVKNGDGFSKIEYVSIKSNDLENSKISLSEFASYIGENINHGPYGVYVFCYGRFSGKIKNITYNSFELEITE